MLTERFPEISFHLQVGEFIPFELFCDADGHWNGRKGQELIYPDGRPQIVERSLDQFELIYVVGMGLGDAYFSLRSWLKKERMRTLIFLEDDLSVIDAFVRGPNAKEILENEQIHIQYLADFEVLHAVACEFPSPHVEVLDGGKDNFETIRQEILKKQTAASAYFAESLHAHKLSKNLLSNLKHLPGASYINKWRGKFIGTPAVICGAGPSLAHEIETLKKLDNRALVMAGGSAITALTQAGVQPHLALAVDPNPQELKCLQNMQLKGAPFIYGNRLFPDVFSLVSGPIGYLSSQTGGLVEAWIEQELGFNEPPIGPELGAEAFSVTTLAISLARALGCDPIILVGVDLAFTGGERYAAGVFENNTVTFESLQNEAQKAEEHPLYQNGTLTLVKWVLEQASIDAFAREYPEHRWINATRGGLGFSSLERLTLEEALNGAPVADLRQKITTLMQETKLSVTPQDIAALLERLRASNERSLDLCQKIDTELSRAHTAPILPTPKMALYESDLEGELIDDCFLHQIGGALETLFARRTPTDLDRLKMKNRAYLDVLQHLQLLLKQSG